MTQKSKKSSKVAITEQAINDLQQMLTEVKGENSFIELTPHLLISWVISRYFQTGFERDKDMIRDEHFNHKKHLHEAIKSSNSTEELKSTLLSAIQRVNGKGRKKPKT